MEKKKNVFEDKDRVCMWCWELDDFPQHKEVLKERKMLGKIVKSLYKLAIEVQKEDFDEVSVSNLFDLYNKTAKSYEKFKEEQTARKRKREEEEMNKSQKKAKLEEDKLLKKKLKEEEKLAKKQKAEEEKLLKKQKAEEEKLLKKQMIEEEKNAKQLQKQQQEEAKKSKKMISQDSQKQTPVKSGIKPITHFFNFSHTPSSASSTPTTVRSSPDKKPLFDKLEKCIIPSSFQYCTSYSPPAGSLSDWIKKWSSEIKVIPSHSTFIFIHDSILNPYFTGKASQKVVRRNPFVQYPDVNYDIDSEEEYEEMNGEDLGEEEEDTSEESLTEEEEEDKWVVPDGYFSASELEEGEEAPQPFVISLNNEPKPMRILKQEELKRFAGFSMKGNLPIECIILETPVPLPKPPKKNIDNYVEDLIRCAEGKNSKKQIIEAFKEIHPDISKNAVENKISEVLVRVKGSGYTLRSLTQPGDISQSTSSLNPISQPMQDSSDATLQSIIEIKPKYASQSKVT